MGENGYCRGERYTKMSMSMDKWDKNANVRLLVQVEINGGGGWNCGVGQ